jgi:hypothetical protein
MSLYNDILTTTIRIFRTSSLVGLSSVPFPLLRLPVSSTAHHRPVLRPSVSAEDSRRDRQVNLGSNREGAGEGIASWFDGEDGSDRTRVC